MTRHGRIDDWNELFVQICNEVLRQYTPVGNSDEFNGCQVEVILVHNPKIPIYDLRVFRAFPNPCLMAYC